ncbi:uncharacterized protein Z518_02861 [Rhinocladiella mackenziei CBS 650.93]|uniref:WDR59/RTC1-like RING zinc finger domain-containing protein n=1 Tax=Rhinocladiella mackenziei CBS 650.93 TaxID=1442369 RepID=A0A0D2JFW1_9EURO|nr:uncharacterized protein Z518_02861 [Rhinocladiella mackenziei CBS 650.93]KIX08205.1 hypothetical protein Z518_02861 [Rhinocladiella mackenziei CBS 650.93]
MSDPILAENQNPLPPPAPPLPPGRLGQLGRIIVPWGKYTGPKAHGGPAQGDRDHALRQITGIHTYRHESSLPCQTATHRTGIPIAALDINQSGTHAILAGKDILKTVRVQDGKVTEDLNLRASIISYASTRASPQLDGPSKRREYLPARDVRWSKGQWHHIIATAATNGRIALYDLSSSSPKTELAWLHEHTGQINKLDFDPFAGYLLLSASQDKSVRLWDLRDPKPEKARIRFEVRSAVRDVRWSPLEPLDFAVCADGGVIQKWDARSPLGPKLSISGHEKACYSLDYHPDGRHVISGGFDKYVRVWDFQSDNRRQKPVFQLRAPHAIRNIRWRPPCRAYEAANSGHWQSTQVAVSYYHDDPRLHIWDLRRPLLPFRELDRYNTPANDLLWANKDMLWTVGDEGIFTQWDVKHASPLYNQLSPCASAFTPDGQYYMFSEDRELRWGPAQDDPALGFLSVPHDRLSSGDDGGASRSLTDDDSALDTTMTTGFRRQERGPISSRSNKSRANSPPSVEEKPSVLPLDKAVFERQDLFRNKQVGAADYIPGVAAEPEVVEFLASHYAAPATVGERMHDPDTILQRLQNVFHQNAAACDAVSMHRMAQSWRILGAVIVPELKDWADANRARRRADAARRRETLESFRAKAHQSSVSPLAGLPNRGTAPKSDAKSQNLMSSLFRGMVDAERAHSESGMDSTSNMTTPVAKPLPSSPSDYKRWIHTSSEEGIDTIAPLPPSILNSHSTAAAAARALIESPERVTKSTSSSPETGRQDQGGTRQSTRNLLTVPESPFHSAKQPNSDPVEPRRTVPAPQNQEDRRAALRDYRVQARPVFTLEGSTDKPNSENRHDSAGSFPMFSASTDSSHRARSLERSFESPNSPGRTSGRRRGNSAHYEHDDESEDSSSEDFSGQHSRLNPGPGANSDEREGGASATDTPLDTRFGLGDSHDTGRSLPAQKNKTLWDSEHDHGSAPMSYLSTAVSSSPDIFHFEESAPIPKPRIHTSNPIRAGRPDKTVEGHNADGQYGPISMAELDCETYLYQDFCPIDLSKYEPKLPFAWSSLPLICQSISFDVENGIGHAQFATHLLMHVHPYFFHPSFRDLKRPGSEANCLADRLMTPHLGHRIIESLFENHLMFLRRTGLFESAALIRKMCVELDYPRLCHAGSSESTQTGGSLSHGDSRNVFIVCSGCQGPMPTGKDVCDRCQKVRSVCPICQSLRGPSDGLFLSNIGAADSQSWGQSRNTWLFCQACGHSGHVRCLMEWFSRPFSEGTCPSQGCGCDCGPGLTRQQRIQQQVIREDEAKLIRGTHTGSGSTKRDPVRATPSPAVDKVRVALRNGVGERATQSGDERSMTGRRASSRGGGISSFSSSRKSVRLITPGEEGDQFQPRS